jgi:hypothetical protein
MESLKSERLFLYSVRLTEPPAVPDCASRGRCSRRPHDQVFRSQDDGTR